MLYFIHFSLYTVIYLAFYLVIFMIFISNSVFYFLKCTVYFFSSFYSNFSQIYFLQIRENAKYNCCTQVSKILQHIPVLNNYKLIVTSLSYHEPDNNIILYHQVPADSHP